MKKTIQFLLIVFTCWVFSCGTKSDQDKEQSDELSELSDDMEQLEEPEEVEEVPDQEVEESEAMEEEYPTPERPADSIKTFILKWKAISRDEYGAMYSFQNKNGEDVTFFHLSIDEFSETDNPYFKQSESEESILPVYTIKDAIKEKWFTVRVEKLLMEVEGAGEENWVDVITKIEPVR